MIVLFLIIIFIITGCMDVYKIEPDGTEEKIEFDNNDDKDEPIEEPIEEPTEEPIEEPIEEPTEEPTEEPDIVEETLFITQFTNDEPYELEVDVNDLDNTMEGWSFRRNTEHAPVTGYYNIDLTLFDAYFINTKVADEKVVYLTFDEGYENGYTETILDVLKENNVKATFFVTGHYINSAGDLVQRMVDEGHVIGNHSINHPKLPELTDEELYTEITGLADKFTELTGEKIAPFFRPPSGNYSERTLYLTRKLGYRTIFWSMAFKDYDPMDQPGKEGSYNHVMDNYHNGSIILLHAVSESSTEALPDIIRDLIAEGYRFGSLYELD